MAQRAWLFRACTVAALFIGGPAYAQTCEMLSYNLDDARTYLQRAARADTLDDARDYARRAASALGDVSMSAMNCNCTLAYSEFDTASSRARRARDASNADDFVDGLNRAIRSYNDGLSQLRLCGGRR